MVNDFLATGAALIGLIDLCRQAGATVVGCGAAMEKTFQGGADKVCQMGYPVESLAKICAMSDDSVEFED